MKLVLYSGGHDWENARLDDELIKLCNKKKPQITFIPSCSYLCESDFRDFINQYKKYNISKFLYFPVDNSAVSQILKEEVFKSDIIHLSGGNTFYFLKHLRKSKLLGPLMDFVKRGGILTGLSAGAIIMTRTIETASMPDFDRDDNDDNLTNLKSMGLVKFDFFPHYKNSKRYDLELLKFSKNRISPLYACPDGAGIIIDGNVTTFVGKVYCFYQGKKFLLRLT